MSGREPEHVVTRAWSTQAWRDLTFLHWRYPVEVLRPLVPAGLDLDVLDDSAWITVAPFRMVDVRALGVRAPGRSATFPELNVRTYVRDRAGRDGIWFFALACPSPVVVAALRAVGLGYVVADASAEVGADGVARYRFGPVARERRPGRVPRLTAEVEVGEELAPGSRTPLVDRLSGRWNAYGRTAGRLLRVPVQHEPWPLHVAHVHGDVTEPLRSLGLPEPDGAPLTQFSPGVSTRVGRPVRLRPVR